MIVREEDDARGDPPRDARIPVILVTGFLGSGKTTLVNRMLKAKAYAHAAVVVNEFGEVSVDHLLIDAPPRRMRIVDGGCMCGHVHEEIATSLLDLYEHRKEHGASFDRVLIETSGLADPVPIIQVLLTDPAITGHFELRSVVAVSDGVQGASHLRMNEQSVKQAAVADVLVISKADLASPEGLDALSERLAELNPGATQVRAAHGDIAPETLDNGGYAVEQICSRARAWLNDEDYARKHAPASADPAIRSCSLVYDQPITLPGFVLWMNLLAGFRGAGLLRVKGIVNVEGRPYAIQAVQSVVNEPVALADWPTGDDRRSRLVFIVRGIEPDHLLRTFETFAFEGGRERRNLTIRADTYARFKSVIEVFREGARRGDKARLPGNDVPSTRRHLAASE